MNLYVNNSTISHKFCAALYNPEMFVEMHVQVFSEQPQPEIAMTQNWIKSEKI